MRLLNVDDVEDAIKKLIQHVSHWSYKQIDVPLQNLGGHILCSDIFAPLPIPNFARSTVDGYAVVSQDTAAASDGLPVLLKLVGEVIMGQSADSTVCSGTCVYVPTGGMMPAGSDAVVMVEYCEPFGTEDIMMYQPVFHGENVIRLGEDAAKSQLILKQGTIFGPPQIAALAAAGYSSAPVYQALKMAIFSTGDELCTPGTPLLTGQVYDMNTYGLQALAVKHGYEVTMTSVLKDDENNMLLQVKKAMECNDIIIISGGSSQGKKDATASVIDQLAYPGVFTHGIALKPGKPTIIGFDNPTQTLLMGLPGHPVSAMIVFETILNRAINQIRGTVLPLPISARLSMNIAGSGGRLTCIPTTLSWGTDGYIAVPVFGKSGLITTLSSAHGFFEIGRNQEGVIAGEHVLVHLF